MLLCFGFRRKKQHTDVSVVAGQFCTETRMFQLLVLSCQQRGWGHRELGGDRTKAADLNCSKRYSVPYDRHHVKKNYKTERSWMRELPLLGTSWASVGGW